MNELPIKATPERIIQPHSRFARQHGWRLDDISLCSSGSIAVSSSKYQSSFVSVYSTVGNSDSRDKPTLLYEKQFEGKYSGWPLWRRISFMEPNSTEIVTCLDDEVQVIDYNRDVVLRSRKVNGNTGCLSISESQIFIGLYESDIVNIYDKDLNRIKSIRLKVIRGDYPSDMTAAADRLYVSTALYHRRAIVHSQNSGSILTEYNTGNDACSVTVNVQIAVVAVLLDDWSKRQVAVYSFTDNNCLVVFDVESGVSRIRISDQGRIVTGNERTGEVKIYDWADIFSFDYMVASLSQLLQNEDCAKLCIYFQINPEHAAKLFTSRKPGKSLMTTLEERRIVQRTDVFSLREAFKSLNMPIARHVVEGYLISETPLVSRFGKFVAEFSTFLTSSLLEAVCEHFSISESEKNEILTDNAPELSLLATLQEKNIITPTDVRALEIPAFADLRQVVAKINRYQRDTRESEMFSPGTKRELTTEEKADMFSTYLHRYITNWYESICPLPWKKACQWTLSDLFIACGLTLTNTRSQTVLKNVDTRCNITFGHIFTHKDLKNARRIVVEGNPGSGKTMLASQIAYDWVKGNLEDIKYAILLQLKYVEDMTIPEAIMKLILPVDSPLTLTDVESILAETDPLKVCLILDGLEEYKGGGGDKNFDPKQSEVMKVMYQEKISECKVIITTRSEYLHDLPNCPMLKIRQFGEEERKNYVEKMFPHDTDKQRNVIMTVEKNPLLLELCDVPLLFVMAVHNIDKITKVSQNETEKVTSFVQNIVETLCTAEGKETLLLNELDEDMESPDSDGEDTIDSEDLENFLLTLEEVAFNGLCTGKQQLSWPMDFVKDNMCNVRSWLDSGILIIEEQVRRTKEDITDKSDVRTAQTKMAGAVADVPTPSSKREEGDFTVMDIDDMPPEIQEEGSSSSDIDDGVRLGKKQPEVTTERVTMKNAITVLQARFLHKIIQEWFAAKHLANLLENFSQDEVDRCLNLISPIELHYILRLACGINGRVTPLILNHLNHYYHALEDDDDKRRPVVDCICQCFVEHCGEKETLKEIIENVGNKGITICEEDSRQLHRAKIFLLNFASENKIVVPKVNLVDVCKCVLTEENEVRLYLNTGVYLTALQAVNSVRISSWSANLEEFNFHLLLEYLDSWSLLQEIDLHFPVHPPILGEELKDKTSLTHKKVTWTIGAMTQYYLDKNGEWCLKNVKGESSSQKTVNKRLRRQDEPSAVGDSSQGGMAKSDEMRSTGEPSVEEESDPRKEVYHTATGKASGSGAELVEKEETLTEDAESKLIKEDIIDNDVEEMVDESENLGGNIEEDIKVGDSDESKEDIQNLTTSSAHVMDASPSKHSITQGLRTERGNVSTLAVVPKRMVIQEKTIPSDVAQSQLAEWHSLLETTGTITKNGGTLKIPNTGVALIIPPNALPEHMEQCEMFMRIIPREQIKELETNFSSNSSTVVELLPDGLVLRNPVRLTLPHCLVLRRNMERKARIFMSHHTKGSPPQWEEQTHLSYHLEDTSCIIMLDRFCFSKYSIDDEIVEAKKLVVYSAARKLKDSNQSAEIFAGYYCDLPSEKRIVEETRDLIIAHRKTLYYLKSNDQNPLEVSLDYISSGWKYCSKGPRHRRITYEYIEQALDHSVSFLLKKESSDAGNLLCVISMSQKNEGTAVQLGVHLKVINEGASPAQSMDQREKMDQSLKCEKTITKSGGTLEIRETGVKCEIPPDALPAGINECTITMTIIASRIIEDQVTSLCSNSTTAVSLVPSGLRLNHPARLTLPHCLKFKANEKRRARIFINNETEGSPSPWEEQKKMAFNVTDSACIIQLDNLCSVKYSIDATVVTAKKISLYTAAKRYDEKDELAEVEVGYHSDIPGGGELLQLNPSMTRDSRRQFVVKDEQKLPLQLSLVDISPQPQWKCCIPQPEEKQLKIPFKLLASSIEHSHLYILKKVDGQSSNCICQFKALQKEDGMPVTISIEVSPQKHQSDVQPSSSIKEKKITDEDSMTVIFQFLSRKLSSEWKCVGRSLGISEASMNQVKEDNPGNIKEVIYQMFHRWKQTEGSAADLSTLINALNKAERRDLAEKVPELEVLLEDV